MDYIKRNEIKKAGKGAVAIIIYIAIVLVLAMIILYCVCEKTVVDGSSMSPLLKHGDEVIIDKVTYKIREPKRFEVIVFRFRYLADTYYVKRIIGLPGEKVQIMDGKIYINGNLLEEDYGWDDYINDPGLATEEIILGDDEYFVLGDNRNVSKDSRHRTVENVKKSEIVGRAFIRTYPRNSIGFIKHK